MTRVLLITVLLSGLLYGLGMLAIRLHMTQLAYHFYDLKSYERSLKEENLRLKLELSQYLSPAQGDREGWRVPQPNEVFLIP